MDKAKYLEENRKQYIETLIRALMWLFGWLPNERVVKIKRLGGILGVMDGKSDTEDSDEN